MSEEIEDSKTVETTEDQKVSSGAEKISIKRDIYV